TLTRPDPQIDILHRLTMFISISTQRPTEHWFVYFIEHRDAIEDQTHHENENDKGSIKLFYHSSSGGGGREHP
ncbi:MAG: hypothetical protein ACI8WB_006168, partial [Phenylobacterium sp.]